MATKPMKKQKLRNNEYYDTQEMFDDLYHKSKNKNNYRFYKLMDLITDERNIELAYRNIKKNTGSNTSGTDEYSNLIFLKTEVHKLIHATNTDTIEKYKQPLKLDKNAHNKLNKLRILVGNFEI